jgi:hypothetical protein
MHAARFLNPSESYILGAIRSLTTTTVPISAGAVASFVAASLLGMVRSLPPIAQNAFDKASKTSRKKKQHSTDTKTKMPTFSRKSRYD